MVQKVFEQKYTCFGIRDRKGGINTQTDYLSDETIKKVIAHFPEEMEDISRRIASLENDLFRLEADPIAYLVRYSAPNNEHIYVKQNSHSELTNILINQDKEIGRLKADLLLAAQSLRDEMISLRRVHICYSLLPEQEHQILKLLYEDGLKWDAVQKEMRIRRNSIGAIRDKAFDLIRSQYRALYSPPGFLTKMGEHISQQGETYG